MSVEVRGKLILTSIDAKTGEILDVDEGSNLVLKTGSASLGRLLTGYTPLPVGESVTHEGQVLKDFIGPVPDIVKYVQFGTRTTPVSYTDTPPYDNGTLDLNLTDPSPSHASPIIEITTENVKLGTDGTIQFTCILDANQGNSVSNVTYTEAVLMGLTSINPPVYKWFARRVFPGKVKNSTIALRADWFIYFYVKESIA
jgi:hypothetical protein